MIMDIINSLELDVKICSCDANHRLSMLSKIDRLRLETANENTETVNVKYELDKAAYKQFIADMKEIEADMKLSSNADIAGEDLEYGDLVHIKSDGKMYKSDCIPVTLKDICEWWIKTYPNNEYIFKNIPKSVIEECPENTEYQRCCNVADIRGTVDLILRSMK
jgi:hypothetical protein